MSIDEVFDRSVVGASALAQTCVDERTAQVGDVFVDADLGAHSSVGDCSSDQRGDLSRTRRDKAAAHRLDLEVAVRAFDHCGDDSPDDAVEQLTSER